MVCQLEEGFLLILLCLAIVVRFIIVMGQASQCIVPRYHKRKYTDGVSLCYSLMHTNMKT